MRFADPAAFGKRKSRRRKLFEPVALLYGTGELRAHILDLSATGALVYAGLPPAAGQGVTLKLGAARLLGRTVWVEGKHFGVAFLAPLDGDTLDELLTPSSIRA